MAETKFILVSPAIPIPHVIGKRGEKYVCSPVGKAPADLVDNLIKTRPDIYSEVAQKDIKNVDLSQYTFKDAYKGAKLLDINNQLSDAGKGKLFQTAVSLHKAEQAAAEKIKADAEEKLKKENADRAKIIKQQRAQGELDTAQKAAQATQGVPVIGGPAKANIQLSDSLPAAGQQAPENGGAK